jgi:hypothetical protein
VILNSVPTRGFGKLPVRLASACPAPGPLIRNIPIAAGGCPLDKANMVSAAVIMAVSGG